MNGQVPTKASPGPDPLNSVVTAHNSAWAGLRMTSIDPEIARTRAKMLDHIHHHLGEGDAREHHHDLLVLARQLATLEERLGAMSLSTK